MWHHSVDVWLTEDEMVEAEELARAHIAAAASLNARNYGPTYTPEQNVQKHLMGLMGEIAVRKHTGGELCSHTEYDARVADVGRYQVKTRRPGGDIIVKAKDAFHHPPSRIYILAWAEPPRRKVELIGWTTLGTLFEDGYESPYDGPGLRLDQLFPIAKLPR